MADGTLTPKQRLFIAEYAKDFNATQAAIRAGYSPNGASVTGSRLLANAKVARACEELTTRQVEQAEATAQWIVERAVEVVKMATEAVPVLDKRGNPTGTYVFDGKSAVGALQLLAKRHAEFSEKHEVTADIRSRVEAVQIVAQMTPDQLRELSAGARNDGG